MNRTLFLVALFLVLGGAVWYALSNKKKQAGTHVSWDMDFAVKNTEEIGKIFIADRKGGTATLERKGKQWLYNGKYPARPSAIESLLENHFKCKCAQHPAQWCCARNDQRIGSLGY